MDAAASSTPIAKFGRPVKVPITVSLGTPNVRRLGRFDGYRESVMESVVSTTPIPETGCPVRSDEELHHETLPLERLRRVVSD